MLLAETVFGVAGLILFGVMTAYTVKILHNIWAHEEFSMTRFLIAENSQKAFKILVVSAMFFSVSMIAAALALLMEISFLEDISKLGSVVLFSGYVYFLHEVSGITTKDQEE